MWKFGAESHLLGTEKWRTLEPPWEVCSPWLYIRSLSRVLTRERNARALNRAFRLFFYVFRTPFDLFRKAIITCAWARLLSVPSETERSVFF